MRAFIVAACVLGSAALAGGALAQSAPPPQPRPQGLVFHVAAAGAGASPVVSLGMAQAAATGALIRQRREMQADCTWSQATDLTVPADSVVPLRDPNDLGGAEQFGEYYAQLFNALAAAKGATASAAQYSCVRRTMTTLASSLIRRRQEAARAPSAPIAPTGPVGPRQSPPPTLAPAPMIPPAPSQDPLSSPEQ